MTVINTTHTANNFPILNCSNIVQLSEFVSQMVPKIWNNNTMTMDRLNCFKLFCQNIIKSTQISSSCILVALFYIYRLRFAYPAIRGSIGSEVRLFTTALVLANKFLDDNTFTNKTWAEVSSIPLRELNIMEMEFLSALQYKTCIHHITFYSWTTQCQYWISQLQLVNNDRPQLLISPSSSSTASSTIQQQQRKRSADHFIHNPAAIKKRASASAARLSYNQSGELAAVEGERGGREGGVLLSWTTSTASTNPFQEQQQYYNNYILQQQRSSSAASAVATVAAAAATTMSVNNIYTSATTNNFIPRRV